MPFILPPGRRRRAVFLVAICCTPGGARRVQAQYDQPGLAIGTRVRIVSAPGSEPFTGNVLRLAADTIAVAVGGGSVLLQLPTTHLASIEVSEGRDRLGWTLGGASIGGLGTAVVTGAVLGRDNPGTLAALAGFIAGGLVGSLTGAIVGALIAPEHWTGLTLPIRSP